MTKTDFLSLATAAALKSSRVSGLPPGVTVAQAALESAWGKSQLAREAHNYFGMKVHGAHPWIELPTTEFRNGVRVRVQARFARYASMDECFADRDALIRRVPAIAKPAPAQTTRTNSFTRWRLTGQPIRLTQKSCWQPIAPTRCMSWTRPSPRSFAQQHKFLALRHSATGCWDLRAHRRLRIPKAT